MPWGHLGFWLLFVGLELVRVSDAQLENCNLGSSQANIRSSKCNEGGKIARDYKPKLKKNLF